MSERPIDAPSSTVDTTGAPAPTVPATSLPAEAGGAAVLTPAAAEMFLRDYYDAVAAGDYDRSWAQLAPEFQTGTARSFDYYTGFWDDNDLEVGEVELVRADADGAVVIAELRWNGSDQAVRSQFSLRRGGDGTFLIADQGTADD